ncbi:MAG: DNA topoisomerase I [Candidatus Thermoplasmatota archaeon]|nr:DNA topoisomerase I [Candidatus Thermoplasmatota archaeon]
MKLVICEKNISARNIAYILSGGNVKNIRIGKTPVYEFKKDDEIWNVIGLRGHIISLDYPSKFKWWKEDNLKELINEEPCRIVSEKDIAFSLKNLVNNNPDVIIATDYDREGELIGVEAINLIKGYNDIKKIKRAKFSSITNFEISNAFNNLNEVDYNLSYAGESRQEIDLAWGAVLTRFISLVSNKTGKDFLSIGRVQSPTLALLVEKEKEIIKFTPKTFWKINAKLKKDELFDSTHIEGQFWDEDKVKKIFDRIKDKKEAIIKKVDKKTNIEYPPSPFNTTSFLQAVSYLRIPTSKAMIIAEELYISGVISYPRTDNTVYPNSLNIEGILKKLSESRFSKESNEVIQNRRQYPTRGKKKTTDHPPIHPVSVPTKRLTVDQETIYELICRRFLATLSKDAISETVDVSLDISGEKFKASGYRLIESNWKSIYNYFKEKRKPIPELKEGEILNVIKIIFKKDQTKPPQRYTEGSLITTMEKLLLGTKSTRSEVISKLYSRKYITKSPLSPTPIAIAVIDAMQDCDVVKPEMTARLEQDMNLIAENKKTLEDTVKESRDMLTNVILTLEKNKVKIKTNINNANLEQNIYGKCPKCGKDLIEILSRNKKRFIGCTGYPNCTNTYPLPQKGGISKTDRICESCKTPIIRVISKGKKPWNMCLDMKCESKK